jgi:hypothetical protein
MGLAHDLEVLERQRRAEIRTLHQTYLRTKRTVIRTASPARIVRRHLGASLAAAAALGMAMAPRPGAAPSAAPTSTAPAPKKSKWGFGALLSRLKPMIHHFAPEAATYIPDLYDAPEPSAEHEETAAAEKPKRSHSMLRAVLVEAATLLLSKVDFHALVEQLMELLSPQDSTQREEEHGDAKHEPHVSVGDFGTVKHQPYEDFQ